MKKIIITLTVIAAAALGAQGQTTNSVAGGLDGGAPRQEARLLFGASVFDFSNMKFSNVPITSITLSGQGLADNATGFSTETILGAQSAANVTPGSANPYNPSRAVNLNPSLLSWDSSFNVVKIYGGNP